MLAAGHRVITYYRRGFGASIRPAWDTNSSRWRPIFMFCSAGSACAGGTGGDRWGDPLPRSSRRRTGQRSSAGCAAAAGPARHEQQSW